VVFFWTREIAGEEAAVLAVLLFTTLPPALAFAGFAYTDLPVAVLVAASVFIFTHWLERPRLRTTLLLGVVTALAVLANFPALLFLPACWAAVACCWWWFRHKGRYGWRSLVRQVVWAALAFAIVLWAGYRFSVKPLMSIYPNAAQDINSLHVPMP
jgi:4-amino-4-deoxy-L-arabinose transferase-like glycosyltransferase